MLQTVYEDGDVLVVWKPAGVESQESRGLGADMVSEIRKYLCAQERRKRRNLSTELSPEKSTGSPEPYVGVIHRLDRPVSGLLVYAKNKTAAARLSAQVSGGKMSKKYLAVLCGNVDKSVDNFADYLLKDGGQNRSRIVDKGTDGGKLSELSYRILERRPDAAGGPLTLAEITLKTGRHHQIRVQMAGHGLPLWGDRKYNPQFAEESLEKAGGGRGAKSPREHVALAAYRLAFAHPRTGKRLEFCRMPDAPVFRGFQYCMENLPAASEMPRE